MKAVIDTNILVDYLQGIEHARHELCLYTKSSISIVTWMEILVGAKNQEEEKALRHFLNRFDVQSITPSVAERAVGLRRLHRIRLPDALIWSTAQELQAILVTRNTRDFPAEDPGIRIPYRL